MTSRYRLSEFRAGGATGVSSDCRPVGTARVELVAARKRLFKPIFGCEMYVAPRRLDQMEKREGRPAVSFNRVG